MKSTLKGIQAGRMKAISHITGGGLTENIVRILPDHLSVTVDAAAYDMPPVFQWSVGGAVWWLRWGKGGCQRAF